LRQAKLLVHFHSVSVLGPESTASRLTGTQPPNMYILWITWYYIRSHELCSTHLFLIIHAVCKLRGNGETPLSVGINHCITSNHHHGNNNCYLVFNNIPTLSIHRSPRRWPFIPPYTTNLLPMVTAEWLSRGDGHGPSILGDTHCSDVPSLISSVNISLRYLLMLQYKRALMLMLQY